MNNKTINNWVKLAEYDISTARAMLESGSIYMLHLFVNKQLKNY